MADQRWYFTKEQILNSPSKRCGIDVEKELSYRQQAAKLIQDMGQKLHVPQLVINTAIVYMHRFYMFHTFTRFHRNSIGPAALFLAAKVEEQPRKLEHVIKVAHYFLSHQEHTTFDTQSEAYTEKAQELVINENILLQTLGFDVAIDHPHTHVVKCFQMVRSKSPYNDRLNPNAAPDLSKHLAETSYIMATNSLHMTTMCLQYRPAVVACVCIYIVCKWSNYEIQRFSEGRDWFCHVDPNVNIEMLEQLTAEFLTVLDKYPNRLKKVMNSGVPGGSSGLSEDRSGRHTNAILRNTSMVTSTTPSANKTNTSKVVVPSAASKTVISHKEYSEKREKERRDKEKDRDHRDKHHLQAPVLPSTSHHHQPPPSNIIVQPSQTTGLPHSRSHSQETNQNIRKPRSDHTRQVSHGSASRTMIPQNCVKDSLPKKEFPVRSEDKIGDKRTSDSNSVNKTGFNDKFKQSVDSRQNSNNDWNQFSQPVDNRNIERKSEIKTEDIFESYFREPMEVKSEPKLLDNLTIKSEIVSRTKGEMKDITKVETSEETKSKLPNSNSFMFKTFSYRDFLRPSEMPPDDIFDTEIDSRPNCVNADFAPSPTQHAKLKSPPLPTTSTHFAQMPPSSVSLLHPKDASNNSVARDKHCVEVPSLVESKPTNHLFNANFSSVQGNHSEEKLNLGNGIGNLSSLQVPRQSTQKRKRTKSRSPRAITVLKPQLSSGYAEPKVLLTSISEEEVKRLTKENLVPISYKDTKQNMIKQPVSSSSEFNSLKVASPLLLTASTTIENINSNNNQRLKVTPTKGVAPIQEAISILDSGLKVRLSHSENSDCKSLNASSVVTNPIALPSAFTQSSHKKHKSDHGHRKHHKEHKEKKKHRHKEKDIDKAKDESKESKEERKKLKKCKKEKHREKEKKTEKGVTTPLKITLVREKGIYTPDAGPVVSRSNTPVALMNIQSDQSLETPCGLKLTIPRSRLQQKTTQSVIESAAMRGLPSQDTGLTPKVKLKLHKDKSEKESRKRNRSPVSTNYPSKLPHSSSSHNTPQVGTNSSYQLPPDPANNTFLGNSVTHIAPGSLHVPDIPRHPLQHSLHPGYSHNPNFTMMPHGNYPIPMSYPIYRGQIPPHNTVTNFPPTVIHNDPFMPPYYPQYSMQLPNMNVPPPSYQNTLFSVPPPGYMQQQSVTSIISENPPLPPEPPPVKPPTPPPE